jgi:hypothetical protein
MTFGEVVPNEKQSSLMRACSSPFFISSYQYYPDIQMDLFSSITLCHLPTRPDRCISYPAIRVQ